LHQFKTSKSAINNSPTASLRRDQRQRGKVCGIGDVLPNINAMIAQFSTNYHAPKAARQFDSPPFIPGQSPEVSHSIKSNLKIGKFPNC